jgi:hypothetical protein
VAGPTEREKDFGVARSTWSSGAMAIIVTIRIPRLRHPQIAVWSLFRAS